VEGVRGTNFADAYDATGFSGSSINAGSSGTFNNFDGQGGDDTIIGNGNTRIQYSNATAAVNVDFVLGTASGDASVGIDHFTGVNAVMGSMFGDTLKGSGNNETFMGLAGNGFIDGRGGFDIAQYNNMTYTTGPISVDLADGIVTGDASNGVDTLRSIEGIQGTNFADSFDATNFGAAGYLNAALYNVGNFGTSNQFEGLGGDDTITGNGNTRLIYASSTGAVTINMAAGTADGDASVGHDTFTGVNGATGGSSADVYDATDFSGINGPFNFFQGQGGNDSIIGNGFTQIGFSNATSGVTINMQAGTAVGDASVGQDSFSGVTGAMGGNSADVYDATNFSGVNGPFNFFQGQGGNDSIIGNGFTQIAYSNATSGVTINMEAGTAVGDVSVGQDSFSGVNSVVGGNLADVYDATSFTGGAYGPSNSFEGAGGNDTVTGNGNTQATYFTATAGVTVDLEAGTADGNASVGHDIITGGVSGIAGSNFNDFLYGDGAANFINGVNGEDLLDSRGGNGDFLIGGAGADTFVYATGYGATVIGDFHHAEGDKINLTGVAAVYSLADVLAAAQPLNGNTDTFIDFGK